MESETSYVSKPHIHLYAMNAEENKINSIRQDYDSDDALTTEDNERMRGVMTTKEVVITHSSSGGGGDHEIIYNV